MTDSTHKIIKLSPEIYNRIAAGEVVERPANIVKELVENSIDAGATKITIQIQSGIKSIQIVDNGCGIESEDLELAFAAHATSKISQLTDLDSIGTLGFRGEALASIASVSRCYVVSRTLSQSLGCWCELCNGEIVGRGECGIALGTTIKVSDIFDNIPARKKFLKKSSTELGHINTYVDKLILSQPHISIKYVVDGKVVYQSSGTGLKDAIYCVWGGQELDNLVYIQDNLHDIQLTGWVSRVGYTKHNNTKQVVVVNGRVVTDIAIAKVVYNCFGQYLMSRQYPVFVLHIGVDTQDVDVNVHPNKLEVRFVHRDKVCGVVGRAVSRSINVLQPFVDKQDTIEVVKVDVPSSHQVVSSVEPSCVSTQPEYTRYQHVSNSSTQGIDIVKLAHMFGSGTVMQEGGLLSGVLDTDATSALNVVNEYIVHNTDNDTDILLNAKQIYNKHNMQIETQLDVLQDKSDIANQLNLKSHATQATLDTVEGPKIDWRQALLVGSLFDTYIILQDDNVVYMVDQHAAHEKLLYDKLCMQIDQGDLEIQELMVPYVFEVSDIDKDLILSQSDILQQIGFEVREYGMRELAVCSVPLVCSDIVLQEFVGHMIQCLHDGRKLSKSNTLVKRLQQQACKAAIKGNQYLTSQQIDLLLTQFANNNSALYCPHGRPIIYTITRHEIERWFRRIV
ncbi:MAG: DNA mismatch repair endonuclease MutL [Clostridiales bacterium]|jgi:DNA mismatch repair protein MutL|nr:DNA mismatch repair endonuclease MutL [Clostridiales bacterium]